MVKEKILILCRVTPEESTKYFRTVCIAGVTDKKEFRRLYPVQFMPFKPNGGIPFRKRDWIECETNPPDDKRDNRKESCKIDIHSVKKIGEVDDEELYHFIEPLIATSVKAIENKGTSLGLIKPAILDYQINIKDTSITDKQIQIQLTQEENQSPLSMIKLGQESKYIFKCEDQKSCWCKNQPHEMVILDWEVNELYRNIIKRTTNHIEIATKMREKMLYWMRNKRNTLFMVGTHHRWTTWMVVSVLYFRKDLSESLNHFYS